MAGIKDLTEIFKHLQIDINEVNVVYVTVPTDFDQDLLNFEPICMFKENEGTTLIIPESQASRIDFEKSKPMAWLTVKAHTDLESIGFTAALSAALSSVEISCNVIAGYYHDHLFVPVDDAQRAKDTLEELRAGA